MIYVLGGIVIVLTVYFIAKRRSRANIGMLMLSLAWTIAMGLFMQALLFPATPRWPWIAFGGFLGALLFFRFSGSQKTDEDRT